MPSEEVIATAECGKWSPSLVSEQTTVEAVWDEEGNEYPELADALQVLLN